MHLIGDVTVPVAALCIFSPAAHWQYRQDRPRLTNVPHPSPALRSHVRVAICCLDILISSQSSRKLKPETVRHNYFYRETRPPQFPVWRRGQRLLTCRISWEGVSPFINVPNMSKKVLQKMQYAKTAADRARATLIFVSPVFNPWQFRLRFLPVSLPVLPSARGCWHTGKLFSRHRDTLAFLLSSPVYLPTSSVRGGDIYTQTEKTHLTFHTRPTGREPDDPGARPRQGERSLVTVSSFLSLASAEYSSSGLRDHGIFKNRNQVVVCRLHDYGHASL